MFKNEYNGRDGNGYQPIKTPADFEEAAQFGVKERPPTVEYLLSRKTTPATMDGMSVAAFFALMFCSFCIGISLGFHFGS